MSTSQRKKDFETFLAAAVAGITEDKDVFEHNPSTLANLVSEADDVTDAARAAKTDPKFTSTPIGVTALEVARDIKESAAMTKDFIDMELADTSILCYFEEEASTSRVVKFLEDYGKVGVLAKPGEMVSDGVVSDMLLVALEPSADVIEHAVTAAQAISEEFDDDETQIDGDLDDDDIAEAYAEAIALVVEDADEDELEDIEEKRGVMKLSRQQLIAGLAASLGKNPTQAQIDQFLARMKKKGALKEADLEEEYDDIAECDGLGLDPNVFSDEALEDCDLSEEEVENLYTLFFGEPMSEARKMKINTRAAKASKNPEVPGKKKAIRNRMLRALGAKGWLDNGKYNKNPPKSLTKKWAKFVQKNKAKIKAKNKTAEGVEVDDDTAIVLGEEDFKSLVDEVVVDIIEEFDTDDVVELFVELFLDNDVQPLDEARKMKLITRAKKSAKGRGDALKGKPSAIYKSMLRALGAKGVHVNGVYKKSGDPKAVARWKRFVAKRKEAGAKKAVKAAAKNESVEVLDVLDALLEGI